MGTRADSSVGGGDERRPLIVQTTANRQKHSPFRHRAGGGKALFRSDVSRPNDELRVFRRCLRWICMDQSSWLRVTGSCSLFLVFAVAIPAFSHLSLAFRPERQPFSAAVQLSLTAAAASSFLCLVTSFRKIGLKKFLFLNSQQRMSPHVMNGYARSLSSSFFLLALFVLPCFAAEAAYKVWWYSVSTDRVPIFASPLLSDFVMCSVELASWLYRTVIFFLTCVLFRMICHLQGLRLEEFVAVLLIDKEKTGTGADELLREHLDIRKKLKTISHRFRWFIISCLLIVTASQFSSVLLTTRHDSVDDLFDTGELAICSIVLVVGLYIVLSSAAKSTHQAQALTSQTAKWHACCTLDVTDTTNNPETPAVPTPSTAAALQEPESESDDEFSSEETGEENSLDSTEIIPGLDVQIPFQKRQALVTYLENNRAGITIFGFTMDRLYLQTIFTLEWTLFLWLLSKTIGIS